MISPQLEPVRPRRLSRWRAVGALALLAGAAGALPAAAAPASAPAGSASAPLPAAASATPPVSAGAPTTATPPAEGLTPCRLAGLAQDAWCGVVRRPLDPATPNGVQIDVHFAVLPALARNKKPDPIVFLAGGPGQSAMALAGPMARQFSRALNRRDLVLVDQRGTGRSAPLHCDIEAPGRPLRDSDIDQQIREIQACSQALQKLPHGNLRYYTTTLAMADVDAVRERLGAQQVNLVGGSYGTRAALEYLRQFPQRVRRTVIDGVAPPDMALPATFSPDAQVSLDAVFDACERDAACAQRHAGLRLRWRAMLDGLPRDAVLPHPLTGQPENLRVTRAMVLSWVRGPLYVPALASALPLAIDEATQGRFAPLVGLVSTMGGGSRGRATRLAMGMHFSVVCAEDMPRMAQAREAPGGDFGVALQDVYTRVCADWPRGRVPDEFYRVPAAPTPVLVMSGGADPVTPPRHGERVTKALGAQARHVVVDQAGHGVMSLPCMRDVVFRFIDAAEPAQALQVDASCAQSIPRPLPFRGVQPEAAASAGARP